MTWKLGKEFLFYLHSWLCWIFIAAQAFSTCGKQGPLFLVVHRLLCTVAPLVAEHRFQMHRLSCSSWAPEHGLGDRDRLSCSTACQIFLSRDQTRVLCVGRRFLSTVPPGESRGKEFLNNTLT